MDGEGPIYLEEWVNGGCVICGKPERGGRNWAHDEECFKPCPDRQRYITACDAYLMRPPKTKEELKQELKKLADSLLEDW